LIVVAAITAGIILAIVSSNYGVAVAVGLLGLLIFLAAVVYAIYLGFLDRLGMRALVLEQVGARAALLRGHRLLSKRLGRVLLVWLISIATGIAVGICAAIVLAIPVIPITVVGIAAYSTGSPFFWIAIVVGTLIFLPIAFVVEGFVIAQSSTYWTLAFRRTRHPFRFLVRLSARCWASFFRPGLTAITLGPRTFLSRAFTCALSLGEIRSSSSLMARW